MILKVGIDPGLHGGLAALGADGQVHALTVMPTAGGEINPGELVTWLENLRSFGDNDLGGVYLEKVGAMPKQGVSSTFKFGCGWGMVRGVCAALGVPVVLVTPQCWKGEVLAGLPHDKDGAIRFCASRWPTAGLVPKGCRVPHDGLADALCLAEYGRRQP